MYISCLLINTGDNNPDRPRPGRLWLRNLYRVHQRLCIAFPSHESQTDDPEFLKPFNPDNFPNAHTHEIAVTQKENCNHPMENHVHAQRDSEEGFLFRIDHLHGGRAMIVVQSAIRPDWDYAFQNADYLLVCKPKVKHYNPHFETGQVLKFLLCANPTKRLGKTGTDGKPVRQESLKGKRVPVPAEELTKWLMRKGDKNGFSVKPEEVVSQDGYHYFNKGNPHGDDSENQKARLRHVRFEGILTVTNTDAFKKSLTGGIGSAKGFGFGLLSVVPVKN